MGMFDSFYDAERREWQTKAFDCQLDLWLVGDLFPSEVPTFQVEVLGCQTAPFRRDYRDGYVTVRDCVVEAIGVDRDERLALIAYDGNVRSSPGQVRA